MQAELEHLAAPILQQCHFPLRLRAQPDFTHLGRSEAPTGVRDQHMVIQERATQQELNGGLPVK